MQIHKYPLGQLKANSYLLINDRDECLLIDPADEANFLLEEIQRRKLTLKALIATHGHFDHIMAVGEIQLSFSVPLYIHEKDIFLLKRVKETAKHFLEYEPLVIEPLKINHLMEGLFTLPGFQLEVIYTPGHTPGSCCFYLKEEQVMFTGDTIFKEAIGRYDFKYSNKTELLKSIDTILMFPEETMIYPGHEEETTVGAQKILRQ